MRAFRSIRWWRAYAVYLLLVAPFVAVDQFVIRPHSGRLESAAILGIVVFAGLTVKDRIERRIWR